MNAEIPYMISTGNLPRILDAIQRAGAPTTFNLDFIKDLGFTSSQDRPTPKIFKYLGFLDSNGHPQAAYREFMDHTKSKKVLATRLRAAFDDLFLADRNAHKKTAEHLKGWFKTKTGVSDSVADKIARTFKVLAAYADFDSIDQESHVESEANSTDQIPGQGETFNSGSGIPLNGAPRPATPTSNKSQFGLVYRFEIHLPDTQNVDTFRAIFRALREELL